MSDLTSISFLYSDTLYYAVVRVKQNSVTEYHITIMNSQMEAMLYGNHVFFEKDGVIEDAIPGREISSHVAELRECIARSLRERFRLGISLGR